MPTKAFLVTGGTGFIGQAIVTWLLQQGYEVTLWTRSVAKVQRLFGSQVKAVQNLAEIPSDSTFDGILNLAGEPIVGKRWTTQQKQSLMASRIGLTEQLVAWMQSLAQPPKYLFSASAIGYYGIQDSHDPTVLNEDSAPQAIFMSELCQSWEQRAMKAQTLGTTVIRMRFGMILGHKGALPPMLLPLKFGLGGTLGNGKQVISWLHIDDVIGILDWLLKKPDLKSKVYNFVAPEAVTQKTLITTAAKLLKRPAFFKVPAGIIRTLLGEQAQILLDGQRVSPKNLLDAGYSFQYPTLDMALKQLLLPSQR